MHSPCSSRRTLLMVGIFPRGWSASTWPSLRHHLRDGTAVSRLPDSSSAGSCSIRVLKKALHQAGSCKIGLLPRPPSIDHGKPAIACTRIAPWGKCTCSIPCFLLRPLYTVHLHNTIFPICGAPRGQSRGCPSIPNQGFSMRNGKIIKLAHCNQSRLEWRLVAAMCGAGHLPGIQGRAGLTAATANLKRLALPSITLVSTHSKRI